MRLFRSHALATHWQNDVALPAQLYTKAFWLEHLWILNLCKLIRPFSPLSSTETDFFWEVVVPT